MSTSTEWTLRNDGRAGLLVRLEPYGQELHVLPGSTLLVPVRGGTRPNSGGPQIESERSGDELVVWIQWSGSEVSVSLDGVEV